jgi:hypothetical protein
VADLTRAGLRELARVGAKARLEELRQEEAAIRKAFPDLFGGRGRQATMTTMARAASAAPKTKKRSHMSAAARKAVSARMKRYWAARRSAKAKGK